jgi:hypothetical protein
LLGGLNIVLPGDVTGCRRGRACSRRLLNTREEDADAGVTAKHITVMLNAIALNRDKRNMIISFG